MLDYSKEMAGKVAIVTGGAAGTGLAISKALVRAGVTVLIACLDVHNAKNQIQAHLYIDGPNDERLYRAVASKCDIAIASEVEEFVRLAFEQHGRVDYLINNAGMSEVDFIPDIKESDWDRIMAVNVKGTHLMTQAVTRKWLEDLYHSESELTSRKGHNIVNICSESAHSPHTMCAAYVASKSAQMQYTKVAAREFIKHGIRVNAINPSITEGTELTAYLNEKFKAHYGWSEEEAQKMYLSKIPAQRFCKPDDVAKATLWLLSSDSSFVIGEGLMVSGGQSICGM